MGDHAEKVETHDRIVPQANGRMGNNMGDKMGRYKGKAEREERGSVQKHSRSNGNSDTGGEY